MPLAGLPSLRAARAVEDEKLAVCEALENAGIKNPGGNVVERWVVADTKPPNMLRLEQCIVCGDGRVVSSRSRASLTYQEIQSSSRESRRRDGSRTTLTLLLLNVRGDEVGMTTLASPGK